MNVKRKKKSRKRGTNCLLGREILRLCAAEVIWAAVHLDGVEALEGWHVFVVER